MKASLKGTLNVNKNPQFDDSDHVSGRAGPQGTEKAERDPVADAQSSASGDPGPTERPGPMCCGSRWTSVWLGPGIRAERPRDRAPRAHAVRGDGSLLRHPPTFLAGSPPGSEAHTPAVSLGSPAPSRMLCASPVPFPDSGPGVPWEGGRAGRGAPCRAAARPGRLPARVLQAGWGALRPLRCSCHMQRLLASRHAALWRESLVMLPPGPRGGVRRGPRRHTHGCPLRGPSYIQE